LTRALWQTFLPVSKLRACGFKIRIAPCSRANGVTWTASASSAANGGTYSGYYAFNNALTAPDWATDNSATPRYTAATPGVPNANTAVVSNVTGLPSGTTITGEWLEIQSSVPLIMYSYMVASGGTAVYAPRTYNIIGSNDRTNWFNLHSASHSTNPTTPAFSTYTPYLFLNYSGSQTVTGLATSTVTTATTSYATNAYTYFRIVVTSVFTGNIAEIGELYLNFQSGATYLSTNYGSTWSTAATAPTTAPLLATSGNGQYTVTGSGQLATVYSNAALTAYTIPTLSGITANINCSSISSTGQFMIILTQGTTNNVFYSTNFGITFTGMTVGTLPMTSCAMSYDGFEITVSNASTVYTLNRNTQGYSITMGNQSGVANQGYNSVAIGNLAGVLNQSANSIILNASGSALLNSYLSGFYVAPIANYVSSSASFFSILGYGSDSQVVQTGLTALANGNVGIGTTNPGYALHVIGAIYASGNITALSDQRYKQNIVRLDRSLDAIRSLSGYSYTREDYRPGEKHIGLLAQEVLTVFPEAVSYDSTNDKYSVNYNCLIAPVVEAIKELYDRSEAQAEIIKSQQSVIESQGKTIQSLLARFDTQ
jgi:hypothetical protein